MCGLPLLFRILSDALEMFGLIQSLLRGRILALRNNQGVEIPGNRNRKASPGDFGSGIGQRFFGFCRVASTGGRL